MCTARQKSPLRFPLHTVLDHLQPTAAYDPDQVVNAPSGWPSHLRRQRGRRSGRGGAAVAVDSRSINLDLIRDYVRAARDGSAALGSGAGRRARVCCGFKWICLSFRPRIGRKHTRAPPTTEILIRLE
ncbi:hypothetical protein EVAR_94825_1 [Eumeta japonica]|uniref:Uncharacterized protein n=1 Tax=Eumeta variegata TaxID=151549 RepID=A0A4C1UHC1_EUMVA|nr:hypothetical protein EVAR_94825_1 [Eumeta japonica]